MKDSDKLEIMNMVLDQISFRTEDKAAAPKMVGRLTKACTQRGFKPAEIGTPVFDNGSRYFIVLENLEGTRSLELTYYKETLAKIMEFDTVV